MDLIKIVPRKEKAMIPKELGSEMLKNGDWKGHWKMHFIDPILEDSSEENQQHSEVFAGLLTDAINTLENEYEYIVVIMGMKAFMDEIKSNEELLLALYKVCRAIVSARDRNIEDEFIEIQKRYIGQMPGSAIDATRFASAMTSLKTGRKMTLHLGYTLIHGKDSDEPDIEFAERVAQKILSGEIK